MAADTTTNEHIGYEGHAGTGKTYNLLRRVDEYCKATPNNSGKRVLALTFMHGSRNKLEGRLIATLEPTWKSDVFTIDAFAKFLVTRWMTLSNHKNLVYEYGSFDTVANAAAQLLYEDVVKKWLSVYYPIVVVDEAQDLSTPKLALIDAISQCARVLIAADDYQCLDAAADSSPVLEWMRENTTLETLTRCRRTNNNDLLAAAASLRNPSGGIQFGPDFSVDVPKGTPQVPWLIAKAICTRPWGSVAILCPSRQPAMNIINTIKSRQMGKKKPLGPLAVRVEESGNEQLERLAKSIDFGQMTEPVLMAEQLSQAEEPALRSLASWIVRQVRICGSSPTEKELRKRLELTIRNTKRRSRSDEKGIVFTTIHGAKNREFDGVVIYWPYAAPPGANHQRRLLYNGVTRARRWCVLVPQSGNLLSKPPFQ